MKSAPIQRGRSPEDTATYGAEVPDTFTRLRRDALRALAAGPFYHHTLIGPVPADLRSATCRTGLARRMARVRLARRFDRNWRRGA